MFGSFNHFLIHPFICLFIHSFFYLLIIYPLNHLSINHLPIIYPFTLLSIHPFYHLFIQCFGAPAMIGTLHIHKNHAHTQIYTYIYILHFINPFICLGTLRLFLYLEDYKWHWYEHCECMHPFELVFSFSLDIHPGVELLHLRLNLIC